MTSSIAQSVSVVALQLCATFKLSLLLHALHVWQAVAPTELENVWLLQDRQPVAADGSVYVPIAHVPRQELDPVTEANDPPTQERHSVAPVWP